MNRPKPRSRAVSVAIMACCIGLAGFAAAATPARADVAMPSPDEVYLRARDRQQRYVTQPYLFYTAHETVDKSDGEKTLVLHMVLRNTDQTALILHNDEPPTLSTPAITPETYVNQAAPTLGPSPNAGFDIGTEPDDPGMHPDDENTVRRSRFYRISLAGVERLDGHSVYHLTLRARSMPERFTTRDLWIDTGNYETLKAVVQAHAIFNSHRVPIYATMHFAEFGRAWLLTRIQSAWNFAATGRVYVDYRYSNFGFAASYRGFPGDPADAPP